MATDTLNKFDIFVEDVAHGVHNLGSDQLTVALTPTANPPVAGNSLLGHLTEISSYANLSTRNITLTTSSQTSGVYKLVLQDLTLTSSGAVDPFQYVVIYNSGTLAKTNPLIGWLDYGAALTLNASESLLLDFSEANGIFTIT